MPTLTSFVPSDSLTPQENSKQIRHLGRTTVITRLALENGMKLYIDQIVRVDEAAQLSILESVLECTLQSRNYSLQLRSCYGHSTSNLL